MRKKILVTRRYPEKGIKLLEEKNYALTLWTKERPMTQDELIRSAGDHHGVLCTLTERIDDVFLSACPHLEIISQFAVGYDNIDIPAATKKGIPVGYTPDAMSEATADTAFGLILAVARKMFFMHQSIISGNWGYFNPTGHLGMELKGKTLGIFGLGRIGIKLAQRCKAAYDMKILYHNRTPNPHIPEELDAAYVSVDTLLETSDIISVHCTLTKDTRHIFDAAAFEKMKPSAIFINTARGAVHNEADLIDAMQKEKIWGVGLDVTDPEPMSRDNPLLFMENACVLPHIGSATIEARTLMSVMAATNIISFYETGKVPFIVNPTVLTS